MLRRYFTSEATCFLANCKMKREYVARSWPTSDISAKQLMAMYEKIAAAQRDSQRDR